LLEFKKFEGPLLMKAVIQNQAPETPLANDRYTLQSWRSGIIAVKGKKRPKAAVRRLVGIWHL